MARRANFRTVLDADDTRFQRTMKRAEATGKRFAGNMAKGLAGIAAGFIGMRGLDAVLRKFDRIGKLSKQFDISAESIQRFDFVAQQSGASIEQIAKAMGQANKAAVEATHGMTSYQRAFEMLGLDAAQVALMDQEEQFKTLAEAIRTATDRNRAYAAAQIIMGRNARELGAVFELGREGITQLGGSINTLGSDGVAAIERLNDAMNKIKVNAVVPLAEAVAALVDKFNELNDLIAGEGPLKKAGGSADMRDAINDFIKGEAPAAAAGFGGLSMIGGDAMRAKIEDAMERGEYGMTGLPQHRAQFIKDFPEITATRAALALTMGGAGIGQPTTLTRVRGGEPAKDVIKATAEAAGVPVRRLFAQNTTPAFLGGSAANTFQKSPVQTTLERQLDTLGKLLEAAQEGNRILDETA